MTALRRVDLAKRVCAKRARAILLVPPVSSVKTARVAVGFCHLLAPPTASVHLPTERVEVANARVVETLCVHRENNATLRRVFATRLLSDVPETVTALLPPEHVDLDDVQVALRSLALRVPRAILPRVCAKVAQATVIAKRRMAGVGTAAARPVDFTAVQAA